MAALLEDRDIFSIVAFDYLDIKDLVTLDVAVAAPAEREDFLDILKTLPYKPPFSDALEKWWRVKTKCLKWLLDRQMFNPEGDAWHVNKKLFQELCTDTTVDYKPILARMKEIFFEGFGSPYDLAGLEHCTSLEHLYLCNYNQPEENPTPINLPNLQELVLQNSKVCDAALRNFKSVDSLRQLNLRHVTFEALSEDVLTHYLNSIHTVKVLNRVDEFFTHFCTRPNRLQCVHVDLLHTTQAVPFSLERLLVNSPHLRELHIERMCIQPQTVLHLIAEHCPQLEYLHLNHVRIADDEAGEWPATLEVPFTRLKISTLLPCKDDLYLRILTLTRNKLRHLHISFAERLTDGGYHQVRDLAPALHTLELDEKQEIFNGEGEKAKRYERVVELFRGSVPNIRVCLWDSWKAEHLKEKYSAQRTVVFSQGQGF